MRRDIVSGFVVFLLALPLSVGIAIASGAPASAGLLAAIVGGLLGSWLGSSEVTINGPAAGLIVVMLAAVQTLGKGDMVLGFRLALAAMVFAGALQVLGGALKLGRVALVSPLPVVHGMLASIGITIMVKQLPVLLGADGSIWEPNYVVAFVGLSSGLLLIFFERFRKGFLQWIPGPLLAVVFGVILAFAFDFEHPHQIQFWAHPFSVDTHHLLNVPDNLAHALLSPDWSAIGSLEFWAAVFTIAAVSSIESLLSVYAVDQIDPWKRKSNLDRELLSKGVCNVLLGFIGGLPIISEIVRSKANVTAGAKTRWSNFFHGLFLLIFLLAFPQMLHWIPLTSLAAILIVVGFRLADPLHWVESFKKDRRSFILFALTIVFVQMSDLLKGVFLGFVLDFIIKYFETRDIKGLFVLKHVEKKERDLKIIQILGPLVSTNLQQLRRMVEAVEESDTKGKVQIIFPQKDAVLDESARDYLSSIADHVRIEGVSVA